jgi:death on curing protein
VTRYLTSSQILSIHRDLITRFGGKEGIRDVGLVDSALGRLQTGYYHDVVEEAAALWESLSQNHPFVDGNKRVAFAATDVFLRINGMNITAPPNDVFTFVINLYESETFNALTLEAWLRENTREVDRT